MKEKVNLETVVPIQRSTTVQGKSPIVEWQVYLQIFQLLDCNQAAFARFSFLMWNQNQLQEIY